MFDEGKRQVEPALIDLQAGEAAEATVMP